MKAFSLLGKNGKPRFACAWLKIRTEASEFSSKPWNVTIQCLRLLQNPCKFATRNITKRLVGRDEFLRPGHLGDWTMSTTKAKRHSIKKTSPHQRPQQLTAKAVSTEKLAEAARNHWRMMKMEQKQARKAFKQAKKAAKLARREAKIAMKGLKQSAKKLSKAKKPKLLKARRASARRRKHTRRAKPAQALPKQQVPAVIPPAVMTTTRDRGPAAVTP